MTPPRWLVQLSDLPWLVVAGALGLGLETILRLSGITAGSPWWVVPARGALAAGGICGWLAFRFGRRLPGLLLGGVGGVALALLPPPLLSPLGLALPAATPVLFLVLVIGWAVIPPLSHVLVLPLLTLAPVRRLASHHPLHAHLREPGASDGPAPPRS